MVLIDFLTHLPLAVVEGVILGFTVGFLARVKPEMLIGYRAAKPDKADTAAAPSHPRIPASPHEPSAAKSSIPLLALLMVLASPGSVYAHRLNATYRVLPDQRIQIESFFPGGYPPRNATIKVLRPDDSVLAEGNLDEKGLYVFHYDYAEELRIVIRAGTGTIDEHGKNFTIPAKDLGGAATAPATAPATEPGKSPFIFDEESLPVKEFLIGIGFLLAAAAFVLSLRNARQLQALKRAMHTPPAVAPAPDAERALTDRDGSVRISLHHNTPDTST
jgi:hypothetical protein